jgi:hypothetical protein
MDTSTHASRSAASLTGVHLPLPVFERPSFTSRSVCSPGSSLTLLPFAAGCHGRVPHGGLKQLKISQPTSTTTPQHLPRTPRTLRVALLNATYNS